MVKPTIKRDRSGKRQKVGPRGSLGKKKAHARPAESSRPSFAERARGRPEATAKDGEPLGGKALRTRDHLIETAKTLFLERGYGGTTIDHIAEAAGVSRASFYTYFPSKRETLLAAGAKDLQQNMSALGAIAQIPEEWTLEDLKAWIKRYLQYQDKHGAFLQVWSQAAWNDAELRSIGVRGSMRAAGITGTELQRLGASHRIDPRIQGQALIAMLDRFWYVWRVTQAPFTEDEVLSALAHIVACILRRGDRALTDDRGH
jgi:AcrR family transcriptional regulator